MRNRWSLVTILLGCLVIVVGCGGDGGSSSTGSSADRTVTPDPTEVPFSMEDVIWTSGIDEDSGEPIDEVDTFTTISDRIVAVVPAANVPAGTEFTATWTIDGLNVPEATMTATVEQEMSIAWVAFEFLRDEGRYFPLGELEVTVTATSGETVEGSVEIGLPE